MPILWFDIHMSLQDFSLYDRTKKKPTDQFGACSVPKVLGFGMCARSNSWARVVADTPTFVNDDAISEQSFFFNERRLFQKHPKCYIRSILTDVLHHFFTPNMWTLTHPLLSHTHSAVFPFFLWFLHQLSIAVLSVRWLSSPPYSRLQRIQLNVATQPTSNKCTFRAVSIRL